MHLDEEHDSTLTRRLFLERVALTLTPALAASVLDAGSAAATTGSPVEDTIAGLLAFMLPGDDAYSRAQGETFPGRGAIDSGALQKVIPALDAYVAINVPVLGTTDFPGAATFAALLDYFALEANPLASVGPFLSPFANLSFREKGRAFELFEAPNVFNELVPMLKFVAGIVPGFVAFLIVSEAGVLDQRTRTLRATPLGWEISHFAGPSEGRNEFKGYLGGRRAATPSARSEDSWRG